VHPEAGNVSVARAWRLARAGLEAACDAVAWVTGLCLAAWGTHDVPAGGIGMLSLACTALAVCAASVLAGLMAGLYRGRWQRGSLDEVVSVSIAGAVTLTLLLVACGALANGPLPASTVLVTGQQALLPTMVGGALIALPTLTATRYVLSAARQRHRRRAAAGVKVIVFGAGEAGAMLISRLLAEPDAAYRPVAILDDDPDKRRLRIHGVPVLGDRHRMGEVAAMTGATVLVIAIVRAS
jgi:FlaA1/EpsC-like NDP-sugar epimerase